MGIDLGIKSNEERFTRALAVCNLAMESNYCTFDEWEKNFIRDMNKRWRLEGFKFSPSVKQMNVLSGLKQDVEDMK